MRIGRKFIQDTKASSTVEFVVMLPFMLAMLGLAGGYAETVSQRELLESATWDAARLMSRSPAPRAPSGAYTGVDSAGNAVPDPYTYFDDQAVELIASRMSIPAQNVRINVAFEKVNQGGSAKYDYFDINLYATADFNSPMMRLTGLFLNPGENGQYSMSAKASLRYLAEAKRTEPCAPADRQQGLCE